MGSETKGLQRRFGRVLPSPDHSSPFGTLHCGGASVYAGNGRFLGQANIARGVPIRSMNGWHPGHVRKARLLRFYLWSAAS